MELKQRVNSSVKLLLLVLIRYSGIEANRSKRSLKQVCMTVQFCVSEATKIPGLTG